MQLFAHSWKLPAYSGAFLLTVDTFSFLTHSWSLFAYSFIRKILVSVKFFSAILGPEMAAPILWTPGKMRSFCRKNHVHKIRVLGGGVYFGFFGGGGSADFIFMGAQIFLIFRLQLEASCYSQLELFCLQF